MASYLQYFLVVGKPQRHFLSLESHNMNKFIQMMSYSTEIAFLALKCKYFCVHSSDPSHVWLFLSECCIFITDMLGSRRSEWWEQPLCWGTQKLEGKLSGVAGEPLDSDGDKSSAAGPRQSFVSSERTVEVALQSAIVSHIPVTPFVTCPSTRLSNDSAFIDIPNGYRRGRLVAILQESVKNSNGTTRLGWEAVRDLAENC